MLYVVLHISDLLYVEFDLVEKIRTLSAVFVASGYTFIQKVKITVSNCFMLF